MYEFTASIHGAVVWFVIIGTAAVSLIIQCRTAVRYYFRGHGEHHAHHETGRCDCRRCVLRNHPGKHEPGCFPPLNVWDLPTDRMPPEQRMDCNAPSRLDRTRHRKRKPASTTRAVRSVREGSMDSSRPTGPQPIPHC